ncbi:unnamed protein product [Amoebophrya sp. A25]|nr:unnamed protein product [Amoebophrya sp. A25]|eukprot:GSA25T00018484001.1
MSQHTSTTVSPKMHLGFSHLNSAESSEGDSTPGDNERLLPKENDKNWTTSSANVYNKGSSSTSDIASSTSWNNISSPGPLITPSSSKTTSMKPRLDEARKTAEQDIELGLRIEKLASDLLKQENLDGIKFDPEFENWRSKVWEEALRRQEIDPFQEEGDQRSWVVLRHIDAEGNEVVQEVGDIFQNGKITTNPVLSDFAHNPIVKRSRKGIFTSLVPSSLRDWFSSRFLSASPGTQFRTTSSDIGEIRRPFPVIRALVGVSLVLVVILIVVFHLGARGILFSGPGASSSRNDSTASGVAGRSAAPVIAPELPSTETSAEPVPIATERTGGLTVVQEKQQKAGRDAMAGTSDAPSSGNTLVHQVSSGQGGAEITRVALSPATASSP